MSVHISRTAAAAYLLGAVLVAGLPAAFAASGPCAAAHVTNGVHSAIVRADGAPAAPAAALGVARSSDDDTPWG